MPSKQRKKPISKPTILGIPAGKQFDDNTVSIGSNVDVGHIALIFGNPAVEHPRFITFSPGQAEDLAKALQGEALKLRTLMAAKANGHQKKR